MSTFYCLFKVAAFSSGKCNVKLRDVRLNLLKPQRPVQACKGIVFYAMLVNYALETTCSKQSLPKLRKCPSYFLKEKSHEKY
jgi:hypothetical protein